MIAVCVKEVPDATAARRIDPATRRLDRSGERTLNPFDAHAVEEALRLKEGPAGADTEVVVLCMGPETAMRTLGKALSLGADRAVLISDDALAGADIWLTAKVLAAALEREHYDLVLLGQQAADSESYVMAASVADRLRRPLVTQVAQLTLEGAVIRAKRQTEPSFDIDTKTPAAVAATPSGAFPAATVRVTVLVAGSTTEIVFASMFGTVARSFASGLLRGSSE